MYNKGGWIAKAGSCKIGLNPKPFEGIGVIFSKGLDVSNINNKKPIVIIACTCKVFDIRRKFIWLYILKIK